HRVQGRSYATRHNQRGQPISVSEISVSVNVNSCVTFWQSRSGKPPYDWSVMSRYEGKNIVITGASAGIGQASAVRFISEGGTVFGLGRNLEGLKETESMVDDPARFLSAHVDMSDDASIVEAV